MIHSTAVIVAGRVTYQSDIVVGACSVIGANGFEVRDGKIVEHKGSVAIGPNVEIAAGVTIDRALNEGEHTRIGNNTKISNQVQIAHGAQIGSDCVICGHAQIARCYIGNRVTVCPSVCIKNDVRVGDDAYIGLGAVVVEDVPPGMLVYGNPAKEYGKAEKK